jgi:sulfur-oxidizing protein SoxY
MQRRLFLKASLTAAEIAIVAALGLLTPRNVIGKWRADVFNASNPADALRRLTGGLPVKKTDAISLEVPAIVEDGRSVQIKVRSTLAGVDAITLLSEKNPNPVVGAFQLEPEVMPVIDTRIKMGGSGYVIALVRADGRFYSTQRRAKVTAGGCG